MCIMRYRFMYVLSRFLPLTLALRVCRVKSNPTQHKNVVRFVLPSASTHKFTWFHFCARALPILFTKSVSVSQSHPPPRLSNVLYMCVCVCVCVQLCVQNLSASEIIIFGYLSHVMAPRRTPQSIGSSSKQLRGGRGGVAVQNLYSMRCSRLR